MQIALFPLKLFLNSESPECIWLNEFIYPNHSICFIATINYSNSYIFKSDNLFPEGSLSFSQLPNFWYPRAQVLRERKWMSQGACELSLLQWCSTLCNPMDCSPPGSSVHKILQARILEWVTISFSLEFICWCNLYYTEIRELLIDIVCILCRYSMY